MGKGLTTIRSLQRKHLPDSRVGEKKMTNSLQGIANKARRESKYRFTNLYLLIDKELLLESWGSLKKKAAAGVDKVTYEEYAKDLNDNLNNLVEKLKSKKYRAQLVRRVYIPKGEGKLRPLGILALEDKLVQKAAALILAAIYEQDFLPISYGYRPGVSARDAVKALKATLQFKKVGYVVEADIRGFFDNLDHGILIKMLEMRVSDRAFIRLIKKWLKAGILDLDNHVINPATGCPQGGIISPILANIYLHYALDKWVEKIVKPQSKGEVYFCRYADDFVCMFQYKEEAEKFYGNLGGRLGKFKLELAEEKTKILKFSRFNKSNSERFDFLGFEFYWDVSRNGKDLVKRRTSRGKLRKALLNFKEWIRKSRSIRLGRMFNTLNNKFRGYFNYYGLIGNSKSIRSYFQQALMILFKWLNRRSQRRSMDWKTFNQAVKRLLGVKPVINERPDKQLILSW